MTIIAFLVDTSASMAQRSYLGASYLDFARQAVELFLKIRQRDAAAKGDRYMLMTFEEYPNNVKSGWKEGQSVFNDHLSNLELNGVSDFNSALESVLRFVNLNRRQHGMDAWGCGRIPSYLEQVIIVSISDGSASNFSPTPGRLANLRVIDGCDLDAEPYRWDHRLFSLVIRLPGSTPKSALPLGPFGSTLLAPPDIGPIENICAAMGGRSFSILSHKMLAPAIEFITQRILQNGVLIRLELTGAEPPPPVIPNNDGGGGGGGGAMDESWKSQLVMLLKPVKASGHWPIPESFWPAHIQDIWPPRPVHPTVLFKCDAFPTPKVPKEVPMDKYELEACPLSAYFLSREEVDICWRVYVPNSSSRRDDIGLPFGYLKKSINRQSVSLHLLPYNYPRFLLLLEERTPNSASAPAFRQKMEEYLLTVPSYYYPTLRKTLRDLGLLYQRLDDKLNFPFYANPMLRPNNPAGVHAAIKQTGRREYDDVCAHVDKCKEAIQDATNKPIYKTAAECRMESSNKASPSSKVRPSLKPYLEEIPPLYKNVQLCVYEPVVAGPMKAPSQQFINPFKIERKNLMEQLEKMRVNFDLQVDGSMAHQLSGGMPGQRLKLQHAEDLHHQAIKGMGDYERYLKRAEMVGAGPQRPIEPKPAREHAFGNPFRLNKKSVAIDEVGEENPDAAERMANGNEVRRRRSTSDIPQQAFSPTTANRLKRKPGPLEDITIMSWKRKRRAVSCGSDASSSQDYPLMPAPNNPIQQQEQEEEECEGEEEEGEDQEGEQHGENGNGNGEDNEAGCSGESYTSIYGKFSPPKALPQERHTPTNSNSNPNSNGSSPWAGRRQLNGLSPAEHPQAGAGADISIDIYRDRDREVPMDVQVPDDEEPVLPSLPSSAPPTTMRGALSSTEVAKKKAELSKIIRTGKGEMFSACMGVISTATNAKERRVFLQFALTNSRRYKREALMWLLERELQSASRT